MTGKSVVFLTNTPVFRRRVELNEVLVRRLEAGEKSTEHEVSSREGHVSEHSRGSPVLAHRVADVHEIPLQTSSQRLRHAFGRGQARLHAAEVRHLRHGSADSARVHDAHKHVVVAHDVTKGFAVRRKSHLRRAVDGVHGLRAEARAGRENGNLARTTLLHARE